MKECSKSIARRLSDPNFSHRYFVGQGLDIGGKPDPLALYTELFSKIEHVRTWDREDGDAQDLHGIEADRYDFVHSSHCLEHLDDPRQGLENWFRVLKPGGHLVLLVPDEDLYEQGVFPSTHNRDHKWTFTLHKQKSWSGKSVNLLPLLIGLGGQSEIVKVELLTSTYRFKLPRYDQTRSPVGECGIEVVVRKRPKQEAEQGCRIPSQSVALDREMRIHLNQYTDDADALRGANVDSPPFRNDKDLS
ncbi:MAG: class I SAM-dependent methyltransferase [Nitrospira sp.]|nr:class I SAM-dependent methyltransferase [Nitrospira sp.]